MPNRPISHPVLNRIASLLALVALSLAALAIAPAVPQAASAAPAAPIFVVYAFGDAPADFTGDPNFTICRTGSNTTCTVRAAVMNANRFAGGGASIIIPSAMIDAGGVNFTLSADQGGFATDDDSAAVSAIFRDENGAGVGSNASLSGVVAAARGNVTGFVQQSQTDLLPPGTRTIEI